MFAPASSGVKYVLVHPGMLLSYVYFKFHSYLPSLESIISVYPAPVETNKNQEVSTSPQTSLRKGDLCAYFIYICILIDVSFTRRMLPRYNSRYTRRERYAFSYIIFHTYIFLNANLNFFLHIYSGCKHGV